MAFSKKNEVDPELQEEIKEALKAQIKEEGLFNSLKQFIFDREEFDEKLEHFGRTRKQYRVRKIVECLFFNFKFLILLIVLCAGFVGYKVLMSQAFLKSLHGNSQAVQAVAIIVFLVSAVLILGQVIDFIKLFFLSRGQMRQTKALRDELGDLK